MNLALLVLHVTIGLLFLAHGAQKLLGWFGGHGIEGTSSVFDELGLRPGRIHAWGAALAETGAGLLVGLGLLTPIGAAMAIAVMTAAIITVHGAKGFFNHEGGYEFNLTLIAAAFALAGAGPGDWSLDHVLGIGWTGAGWALIALGAGVLGGVGMVIQGRTYSTSRGDHTPPATA